MAASDSISSLFPAQSPARSTSAGEAIFERFRPKTWSDVLGQPKALKELQTATSIVGIGGNAFWIAGASGTGKTTIARLLASEVADDFSTREIEARSLTPTGVKDIEDSLWNLAIGKGGHAIIVNEAHWLRKETIGALLDVLERLPAHVVWIFTTTNDGQTKLEENDGIDFAPFLSRCIEVQLARRDLTKAFAPRLLAIATELGVAGEATTDDCVKLLQATQNNFRRALQNIIKGALLR